MILFLSKKIVYTIILFLALVSLERFAKACIQMQIIQHIASFLFDKFMRLLKTLSVVSPIRPVLLEQPIKKQLKLHWINNIPLEPINNITTSS
jgi:hypothetical protein